METVGIDFQANGLSQVMRAIEGIEARLVRFEKTSTTAAEREAKARVRAAEKERKSREREYSGMFDQIARREKQATREQEKAAKERERAARASSKSLERQFVELEQAHAKAERDKTRVTERETRRREQIVRQSALMAGRLAKQQAAEEMREAKRVADTKSSFNRAVRGNAAGGLSGMGSRLVAGGTMLAGAALTLGGGFAIADVVQSNMAAERAAVNLSNSAYIPGSNQRPDKNAILSRAASVQAGTNIDKATLIGGMQDYVAKSSDYKGGMENLGFFAQLAKASGSDFKEVMSAAGALRSQNENMGTDEMKMTMRNIIAQGKLGAVEMKDLAGVAGKITASSAMYGGDQSKNQAALLGLSQIAMKTSGSAEEAATSVTKLGSDALTPGKQAAGVRAALGINLTDKKTGLLKSQGDIIEEVFSKTGGKIGKIDPAGFGGRSIRIFEALAPMYQEAEKAKKGSGAARVRAEVNKFTGASYSSEDVNKDFSAVMSTSGEKIDAAMNKLKEAVADKLIPHFERLISKLPELIPKIEKVIDAMGRLADWLIENPWKGIGIAVSGAILKEIAAAAIGAQMSKAIQSELGGKLGAGLTIATASFAIAQAGMIKIDKMVEDENAKKRSALEASTNAQNAAGALASLGPNATKEDVASAQKKREEAQAQLEAARGRNPNSSGASFFGGLLEAGGALLNSTPMGLATGAGDKLKSEAAEMQQNAIASQNRQTDNLVKSMAALDTAIANASKSLDAMSTTASNANSPSRNGPIGGDGRKN